MTSTLLLPRLIQRPLLPKSCNLCNRYTQRYATSNSRKHKRELAARLRQNNAKKKKQGIGSSPAAADAKKKAIKSPNSPKPSTVIPPTVRHKGLKKAPHMHVELPSERGGWLSQDSPMIRWLPKKGRMLFFAGFVVPTTVTMLLLVVKPELRPEWMGGSPARERVAAMIPSDEAPVYDDASLKNEMEKSLDTAVNENDGTVDTNAVERKDITFTDGISDNEVESLESKKQATDLFSAIGIRPHPSA